MGASIPSATGLGTLRGPGTRGWCQSVPQLQQNPPNITPNPVAPILPLSSPSLGFTKDECGGVVGSGREREIEKERLLSAMNSGRTAVQLWLSKREELMETGSKARQLHPLGCLGLPTTSPCFSKPYVHPLPNPTPLSPTQLANKQVRKP